MGLFSIFRKPEVLEPIDFGTIAVDMHSHLIPGIDDGSPDMDSTIAMLAKFESMGYRKVITTPHIFSDYYKNTPEIILGGLAKVKATAKQLGLSIVVEAAAEYYYDEYLLEQIKAKNILTFGDNYVLVEFAFMNEPTGADHLFFELQAAGYKPILAHFERYTYWHGSVDKAQQFREKGVKIQLNINSLTGHYGPEVKKQGELLVDQNLVDFAGSDCHRIDHLMKMEKYAQLPYFHKLLKNNLLNSSL